MHIIFLFSRDERNIIEFATGYRRDDGWMTTLSRWVLTRSKARLW